MTVWSLTTDTDNGLFTSLYLSQWQAYEALITEFFPADQEAADDATAALNRCTPDDISPIVDWFAAYMETIEGSGDMFSIERHDHPWTFGPEDAPTPAYTNPDNSPTPGIDRDIPLGSIVLPGEKVIEAAPDAQKLLDAAAEAQTTYWDALYALEQATDTELDTVGELAGLTVADLIENWGPDGAFAEAGDEVRSVAHRIPGKSQCADCGKLWKADELDPIDDIEDRVEAGEVHPSGQCPQCGALCHPL